MKKNTLSEIGEFGFIDWINKEIHTDASVLKGIGDDAAILRSPGVKKRQLLTTDMLIENRHFNLKDATGYEIGRKALAVNISDIAAMGGIPTQAVIAVGAPANMPLVFLKEIYRGLKAIAKEFKINIVGGDTNRSDKLVLSATLLGEVEPTHAVGRDGAKKGDVIFVTGALGGSYRSGRHLNFTPRIAESRYLVENFKVSAMMDISDGLSSDIRRLTEASGTGAYLCAEAIPVSKDAKGLSAALEEGEDFELLFTLSPRQAAKLTLDAKRRALAFFSPVGRIVAKKEGVKLFKGSGSVENLLERGFDHFSR